MKWICCKCGVENDSGYECIECGSWNINDYVCSECGSLNDPDESCKRCGHEYCEDCVITEDEQMIYEDYPYNDHLIKEQIVEATDPLG